MDPNCSPILSWKLTLCELAIYLQSPTSLSNPFQPNMHKKSLSDPKLFDLEELKSWSEKECNLQIVSLKEIKNIDHNAPERVILNKFGEIKSVEKVPQLFQTVKLCVLLNSIESTFMIEPLNFCSFKLINQKARTTGRKRKKSTPSPIGEQIPVLEFAKDESSFSSCSSPLTSSSLNSPSCDSADDSISPFKRIDFSQKMAHFSPLVNKQQQQQPVFGISEALIFNLDALFPTSPTTPLNLNSPLVFY